MKKLVNKLYWGEGGSMLSNDVCWGGGYESKRVLEGGVCSVQSKKKQCFSN